MLREHEQQIWLLTEEFPVAIKLYDFRWNDTPNLYTEYLQETEEGIELVRHEFNPDNVKNLQLGQHYYQYFKDSESVTIRGLGRISELNKNGSILGYKRPFMIIPGIIYNKVLWIRRNGVQVFHSTQPEEWTTKIPCTVLAFSPTTVVSSKPLFDLSGRRLSAPPAKGIYIENGQKRVARGKE